MAILSVNQFKINTVQGEQCSSKMSIPHTAICTFLLFVLFYRILGNWEVPIRLWFNPLEITGGFPTYLYSYYVDFFNFSREANWEIEHSFPPRMSLDFKRSRPWECLVQGENSCLSDISEAKCSAESHFSFSKWSNSRNSTCETNFQLIECKTPVLLGSMCVNIVAAIRNISDKFQFRLSNASVNSKVFQTYSSLIEPQKCNCTAYLIGDVVKFELRSEIELGSAIHDCSDKIQFGMNSIEKCRLKFQENQTCGQWNTVVGEFLLTTPKKVCTCGSCDVPIIHQNAHQATTNGSACQIPIAASIQVTEIRGLITAFVVTSVITFLFVNQFKYSFVTFEWIPYDSALVEVILRRTVTFHPTDDRRPATLFDLRRGRFHCPSEVSCWKEVFYPLSQLYDLDTPAYQFVLAAIAAFIYFAIFRRSD